MKKIFFCIIFALCAPTHGGQKGFSVILFNFGDKEFVKSSVFNKFLGNFDNSIKDNCWSYMHLADGASGIRHITLNKIPEKINTKIVADVWAGDKKGINFVRSVMHQDDGLTPTNDGYHARYIIKPEGNKLTLMGLGANEDRKKGLSGISEKVTVTLDDKDPKKAARQFEQALCKVSKPFNIGFSI